MRCGNIRVMNLYTLYGRPGSGSLAVQAALELAAVIAELLATNRKLLEDIRYTAKRSESAASTSGKSAFALVVPHRPEKPRAVTRS